MKKFEFSLEKILKLRKNEQNIAQMELGKVIARINALNDELKLIAEKKAHTTLHSQNDLNFMVQTQNYFFLLDQQKNTIMENLANAELEADEKRAIVIEATKKVKALEKLKERKYEQYKEALRLQENKELSDLINIKSHMNNQ